VTPARLAALLAVLAGIAYRIHHKRRDTHQQGHEWMAARRDMLDPKVRTEP
jgi:hypothetical protein